MITKQIKYYELSFGDIGNNYPKEEYIYYTEGEINIEELIKFLTEIEEKYESNMEMTVREVVVDYIHKFSEELFVAYGWEPVTYGSDLQYYESLEALLLNNNLTEGDLYRFGFKRKENGELDYKKLYTSAEFESECFINRMVISEKRYTLEQEDLLKNDNEIKRVLK